MYLLPSSCHPKHNTRNIPYSQALRLRRLCSDDSDFGDKCGDLSKQLEHRGYQTGEVKKQIAKAKRVPRAEALKYSKKSKSSRTPLVTTYHPNLPPLQYIIRKNWSIIESHHRLKTIFPEPPVLSFKRPKNLRDILVHAEVKDNLRRDSRVLVDPDAGCKQCKKPKCKLCKDIQTTTTFSSHVTGKSYEIRQSVDCTSTNVIYLIDCDVCGIQYVGETMNDARERFRNHRSTIKHHKKHPDKPVASHFGHHKNGLKVTIIECLGNQSKFRRLYREKFWIETLQTHQPSGLNIPPC